MRMRTILACFHLLNFAIMIAATAYVLSIEWHQLEEWMLILYIYYVILGVSGVSLAAWIGIDGKRLESYAAHIKKLEEKITALEKKIKLIKRH